MDNDDLPRGRVLSRREVIALLGASGAMLFVGCAASTDLTGTNTSSDSTGSSSSSCVVRPELTEGPYYVDEELDRSDGASREGRGDRVGGTDHHRPPTRCSIGCTSP